jgi:methylmalonyl-CoA mutase C-terminal domain/subunit
MTIFEGQALRGKRILIAKPGLDGHDVGAKVISLALRDAGAEVIYTGLRKSPEYVARVATEEGVDAVGLSLLSGSHKELVKEVIDQLHALKASNLPVFVGGTIPPQDREHLLELGVKGIFTSDMRLEDVVASLAKALS